MFEERGKEREGVTEGRKGGKERERRKGKQHLKRTQLTKLPDQTRPE